MDVSNILSELRTEDQEELEDEKDSFFLKYQLKYPELSKENFLIILEHVLTNRDGTPILNTDQVKTKSEEKIEEEKPEILILRFRTNLPSYSVPIDLLSLFNNIVLGENLLVKTFYDYPVEKITSGSGKIEKIINEYIYSEHAKPSEKKYKLLRQGVVSCLYYTTETQIKCSISDTGIVSLLVIPNFFNLDKNKKDIKDFYKKLSGSNLEIELEFTDIDVKFLYSTYFGYFTKETICNYEKVIIKNNISKIPYKDKILLYSSNDNRINFTLASIEKFEDIQEVNDFIIKKVKNYMSNLTEFAGEVINNEELYIKPKNYKTINEKGFVRISSSGTDLDGTTHKIKTIRSSGFTIEYSGVLKTIKGNFILTSVLKKIIVTKLRNSGLVVDSTKCEKKRRPIAYFGEETDEKILVIGDNKFICPVDYPYHGLKDKVNCCFKRKQLENPLNEIENNQENVETIESIKNSLKKTPLKKYTNMKKFSHKTIDGSTMNYFGENYFIMSPAELKKDRTILSCLSIAYGKDIENVVNNITEEQYKLLDNKSSLLEWKNEESKSIDDMLYLISIAKKVNIIIIQEDLLTKCTKLSDFSKILILYRYTDSSYYIVVDKNFEFEHQSINFQRLIEDYSKSCDTYEIKGINSYTQIIKKQILDINGLVVFIEMKNSGIIPITPSTVISLFPSIDITSTEFKLLTPESQYNSLKSLSETYQELEPIGLTKGLTTKLVTGIKIKNGGICPVSQQKWETDLLPDAEDLFYIERYSNKEDIFQKEEEKFAENLEKIKNTNIENLMIFIKSGDYVGLISYLKEQIQSIEDDVLSKIVWYLINNEGF